MRFPAKWGGNSAVLVIPFGNFSEITLMAGLRLRVDLILGMLDAADKKVIRTPWENNLLESWTNALMWPNARNGNITTWSSSLFTTSQDIFFVYVSASSLWMLACSNGAWSMVVIEWTITSFGILDNASCLDWLPDLVHWLMPPPWWGSSYQPPGSWNVWFIILPKLILIFLAKNYECCHDALLVMTSAQTMISLVWLAYSILNNL